MVTFCRRPSAYVIQWTMSAFTSANTKGASYFTPRLPSLMAATGHGPQQNSPGEPKHNQHRGRTRRGHRCPRTVPSLRSWGVGSKTCQPSCPGGRSSLFIQASTQQWKFLQA